MEPVLETPVTLKVTLPLDLNDLDTRFASPLVPVEADELPLINPLHVPVTVAPETATLLSVVTLTVA